MLIIFLVGLIRIKTDVSPYQELLMPNTARYLSPEPLEMPQYVLTIVLLPSLYLLFDRLFGRIPVGRQYDSLILVVVFDLILLLAAGVIGVYQAVGTPDFSLIFMAVSVLLAVFVEIVCDKTERKIGRISAASVGRIWFFLVFAASIILGFYLVCRVNRMLQDSYFSVHHFYAWWYPVYKVGSGMTIGVDFDCLYGFYPYLVVPFLKLLGGVNQQALSVYLSVVLSLISVCFFAFSYKFITSRFLAGIVGFAASFYGPLCTNYLAWNPSRTLFPALVLGGTVVYTSLKEKGKRTMRVLMALLLGLGLAWNIEMGFVALISWAGFLIFRSAAANGLFSKKNLTDIGKVILFSLLSVAVAVVFIEGVTCFRSAHFIGLDSILFGITVFAGAGFLMVKMTFKIWVFVALPVAAGLFASLPNITKIRSVVPLPENTPSALFTVSIITMGSFSYFIGRSVPENSLSFLLYDVVICGILAELYLRRAALAKENGCSSVLNYFEKTKAFLSLLVVSFTLVWAVLNIWNSFGSEYREEHLKADVSYEAVYSAAQNIRSWAERNGREELPHLLIQQSCFVNEALNRPSSETVCEQIDWFYRENAHTYIDFIRKHPNESFVMDEEAKNALQEIYPEELADALSGFTLSETIPARTVVSGWRTTVLYVYLPSGTQP